MKRCRQPTFCWERSSLPWLRKQEKGPHPKEAVLRTDFCATDARLFRLADLEDRGAAVRARAPRCGFAILHRDRLRVFHLDHSFVLEAVAFHVVTVLIRDSVVGWASPF